MLYPTPLRRERGDGVKQKAENSVAIFKKTVKKFGDCKIITIFAG